MAAHFKGLSMKMLILGLIGAVVGALFGLLAWLLVAPAETSLIQLVGLFAFGTGCLGVAVGAFT